MIRRLDIKAVNILVGFEDMGLIKTRLEPAMREQQTPTRIDGRLAYRAFNDWGWPQNWKILPKIADFGLAREGDTDKIYRLPIQPPYYTAPEVMTGIGWSYSADIWNFGVLVGLMVIFYIKYTDVSRHGCSKKMSSSLGTFLIRMSSITLVATSLK